ncbi:hypothetical protein AB0758_44595 [Tolypothrix bouteillei VB521301_2]
MDGGRDESRMFGFGFGCDNFVALRDRIGEMVNFLLCTFFVLSALYFLRLSTLCSAFCFCALYFGANL